MSVTKCMESLWFASRYKLFTKRINYAHHTFWPKLHCKIMSAGSFSWSHFRSFGCLPISLSSGPVNIHIEGLRFYVITEYNNKTFWRCSRNHLFPLRNNILFFLLFRFFRSFVRLTHLRQMMREWEWERAPRHKTKANHNDIFSVFAFPSRRISHHFHQFRNLVSLFIFVQLDSVSLSLSSALSAFFSDTLFCNTNFAKMLRFSVLSAYSTCRHLFRL